MDITGSGIGATVYQSLARYRGPPRSLSAGHGAKPNAGRSPSPRSFLKNKTTPPLEDDALRKMKEKIAYQQSKITLLHKSLAEECQKAEDAEKAWEIENEMRTTRDQHLAILKTQYLQEQETTNARLSSADAMVTDLRQEIQILRGQGMHVITQSQDQFNAYNQDRAKMLSVIHETQGKLETAQADDLVNRNTIEEAKTQNDAMMQAGLAVETQVSQLTSYVAELQGYIKKLTDDVSQLREHNAQFQEHYLTLDQSATAANGEVDRIRMQTEISQKETAELLRQIAVLQPEKEQYRNEAQANAAEARQSHLNAFNLEGQLSATKVQATITQKNLETAEQKLKDFKAEIGAGNGADEKIAQEFADFRNDVKGRIDDMNEQFRIQKEEMSLHIDKLVKIINDKDLELTEWYVWNEELKMHTEPQYEDPDTDTAQANTWTQSLDDMFQGVKATLLVNPMEFKPPVVGAPGLSTSAPVLAATEPFPATAADAPAEALSFKARARKAAGYGGEHEDGEEDDRFVAKSLSVPEWPTKLGLDKYDAKMVQNLVVAGRRDDKAEIPWFCECRVKTLEQLEFAGSKRMAKLDNLLSVALPKIFPKKLREKIDKINVKLLKDSQKCLTGRQLQWYMYDSFKTEPSRDKLFSAKHILTLLWLGDQPHQMQKFLDDWDMVWENCADPPGESSHCDLFYDQIKESKVLKPSVDHYTREKAKGERSRFLEDINYAYLRTLCEDYLTQQEYDVNLANQEAEFAKIGHDARRGRDKHRNHEAAPAPGQAQAKLKPGPKGPPVKPVPEPHFNARDDPGKRCYFHTYGLIHGKDHKSGCSKGDGCGFAHEKIPPAEFKTWLKPSLSGKTTPKDVPKGKGKGKDKSKGKELRKGSDTPKGKGKGKMKIQFCHEYHKDGTCSKPPGTCPYPHLTKEAVVEAQKKLDDKIKAGKSKGKGKDKD